MVRAVPAVTDFVVIEKLAVVVPAATVTDAGTEAALTLLLVSVITAPPAGAAAPRVTVPVLFAPAVTVAGFTASEPNTAGAAIFTMNPSFPPAVWGCTALDTGKFVDPV